MNRFEIQVLGSGSALPTTRHNPSSQLVNLNEKLYMIDCGEGTQLQMRKFNSRINKVHSIFISHLHGDHIFGLPGLLSTLSLLGRRADIDIYAHAEFDSFLAPFMKHFGNLFSYKINHIALNPDRRELVFENSSLRVYSFPLQHRIATNGFLFAEKESMRHIRREMIDFYNIPVRLIKEIKSGADFVTPEGKIVHNQLLTTPPAPPRKYAYCSDTAFLPDVVPHIENADLLYHEATFAEADLARAQQTFHSTARQAASIALEGGVKKLIIGHFSSRYKELDQLLKEAAAVFPNTELAEEGKTYQL